MKSKLGASCYQLQTPHLTDEQVASALGISPRVLENWHNVGFAPPSFLIDGKRIYPIAAFEHWASDFPQKQGRLP